MEKLLRGIVDFRQRIRPDYKETFAKLALEQRPDVLFVACSDSRVVPNLFASTNPGDLFVVRNVGNLIPPCGPDGLSESDESEAAAIEFALEKLNVSDIIICGHSECGAMCAMLEGRDRLTPAHLRKWLRHADPSLEQLHRVKSMDSSLSLHNELSQINALGQLRNLGTYPLVRERLEQGKLRLHAWWFDIAKADVYAYDGTANRFVVIDERSAARLLRQLQEDRALAEAKNARGTKSHRA